MAHATHNHKRSEASRADLAQRLRRIEGQVRGIARMVDDDRYCVEILHQVAAVRAALRQVEFGLLEEHTRGCVTDAIKEGTGESMLEELMSVIRKIT